MQKHALNDNHTHAPWEDPEGSEEGSPSAEPGQGCLILGEVSIIMSD